MRALLSLFVAALAVSTMTCSGGNYVLPTAPSGSPPSPVVPWPPNLATVPVVSISVGEVVHDSVRLEDPICDPYGWDANAQCKRFEVVASHDGTLHAILKTVVPQRRDDLLDMLFSCPGEPRGYSGGGIEQRLSAPVQAGQACLITINFYSYLGGNFSMEFELRTEM